MGEEVKNKMVLCWFDVDENDLEAAIKFAKNNIDKIKSIRDKDGE